MEFRNFIENAGYFDDKEDIRPTGSGRQQEMPGISMVAGTSHKKGRVIDITYRPGKVLMTILDDDPEVDHEDKQSIEVVIPAARYRQEREEAPKQGDTVQVELDGENRLISYDILHRA